MKTALSSSDRQEIHSQVQQFLGRAASFRKLPGALQRQVHADTTKLVERLAQSPEHVRTDPYDFAQTVVAGSGGSYVDPSSDQVEGRMTGNVKELLKNKQTEIGNVIGAGVTQAARMVHEIDFPSFVASLIEGTFHAIVRSSIEQMKAYADMVKSVSTSLNDFRDQNTTDNQARDQLVQRYPQHLQLTIVDGQPKVGMKEGADDLPVPNFQRDLRLSESIDSLDDDTIEEKLVPAARDDLALQRQQTLATIVLMGINRIIVTDGKINAKIKFQFQANEKTQLSASAFDYVKTGNVYASQGNYDSQYESDRTGASVDKDGAVTGGSASRTSASKGGYTSTVTPDIRVTSQVDTSSTGALQASGQIMGEVSVNFKSETFPLERMVDTNQMLHLQNAQQGAGRGAPPGATTPASGSSANAAAPAPSPATSPPAAAPAPAPA